MLPGYALSHPYPSPVLPHKFLRPPTPQRLNAEINKALQAPAVVQAFADGGIVSLAASPERFASFIRSETEKYAQVIRKAGITAES